VSTKLHRLLTLLVAAVSASLATASFASAATLHPITLNAANWSGSAGFGSTAPAFLIDGSGIVHLQGAAKQVSGVGSNADLIGTLPVAVRPRRDVYTVVHTFAGTYADLAITTRGQVELIPPRPPAVEDLAFVSLENISYQPAGRNPVTAIPVNAANWSSNAGFAASAPAAYKDNSGVVHLQGAAKQTSVSGPNPNLLGTLPISDRPPVQEYYVVHTFAGTYADLNISTNGTINLIGPRPPAVKDYNFVSLEGITFEQNNQQLFGMLPNSQNWGPPGFGAGFLGWFRDKSGLIHLVGATGQISTSGPDPNLVATLPIAASPNRTVYEIVHTFNGTYADLAIQPNGQVLVISPRPPAVQDLTFLTLEGITYQR
jgi:hypothetical protein